MGDGVTNIPGSSTSGGGGSADAYIGSLISLTSKSEIRYEGILYTVDTANSNIALQDVRSFGTEGRKKDGPQVPPSDKVYDYIIFRGTDIKDLQVKSSPPVRPPTHAAPHHDPAIISLQSQPQPPPSLPLQPPAQPQPQPQPPPQPPSQPSSRPPPQPQYNLPPPLPPPGTLMEGPPGVYSSISSGTYGNNLSSLYPPASGLRPWGMPPGIPPGSNGSLGMPLYWPAYYRPPGSVSHLQQQTSLPIQGAIPSFPQNYLPQTQSLAQSTITSTQGDAMAPPTSNQSSLPLLPPALSSKNVRDLSITTPGSSTDTAPSSVALPTFASSAQIMPIAAETVLAPEVMSEKQTFPITSSTKTSLNVVALPVLTSQSVEHLPTPGVSSMRSEVLQDSSKLSSQQTLADSPVTRAGPLISTPPQSSLQSSNATNQPLLPLPLNQVRQSQGIQANGPGTVAQMRRGRGRGRGIGTSQSQRQFTEDFDFSAMNEKFNKDEVWGELGKGDSREKADSEENLLEDYHEEEEASRVPVYVKDDFFDTLSCDALGRAGMGERMRFSEQRKIDTETFGSYSVRPRTGRGGRGGYRGGYRGGFYGGRGTGNGGRGRNFPRSSAF